MCENCSNSSYYYDPCNCGCDPIIIVNSYGTNLNGSNEVLPNLSAATGTFVGLLKPDGSRLDYVLQTNGLVNISGAGFYLGLPGQNGTLVKTIPISFANGLATGSWTSFDAQPLTPALINSLVNGQIYINITTAQYPGGEIRGQIYPLSSKAKN